jgi:hypothetical protein
VKATPDTRIHKQYGGAEFGAEPAGLTLLDLGCGLHTVSTDVSLTLSQLREWDTEHLTSAARHWSATASRWEGAFAKLEHATHMPGETPWEGAAARAAQDRAYADRRRVSAAADQLDTASSVARTAAGQLQTAQQRVLAVVDAAEASGFGVGEDFSLTAYRAGAEEITAAEAHMRQLGRQLRHRIEELLELDQQVATRIAAAADGVGTLTFTDADEAHSGYDAAVDAVDYRVLKEAPPQPPPPDPKPGPLPPINGADDVKKVLEPLQNGGRRGPNGVGTKSGVKEIWDEPSTRRLWDYLTRNTTEGTPPPKYKGTMRVLPDGTRIGFRASESWGDTIDVWYPDRTNPKTHIPYEPYFPPLISGPPHLPPPAGMPSVQIFPPQLTHPPTALPPAGIFEPNGLPPWLQNPSAPGLHTPAQPPTIMPGVALPDVPQASAPAPYDGPGLPEMGGAFVDAGEAVGTVIVGGVVIIGGLLGTVASPGGQMAH